MEGAELEKLHPWYRGFRGIIEQVNADKYKISGTITKLNNTTVEITELPIRSWTQGYKEQLEEWMVGGAKTPAWILVEKTLQMDSYSFNFRIIKNTIPIHEYTSLSP